MILDLTKSTLFKVNPDDRFAREYQIPKGVWTEVWKRYKLMDYTHADIKDYLFIKHMRNISYVSIGRWIVRTEIYSIANPLVQEGVKHVNSEIFRQFEQQLMNELVKELKSGVTTHSKTII